MEGTDKKTDKRYTINALMPHCRELFGCSTTAYAGATAEMTGTYTVAEMKKNIQKWMKREVK